MNPSRSGTVQSVGTLADLSGVAVAGVRVSVGSHTAMSERLLDPRLGERSGEGADWVLKK
jgi:hypothetical protein